jgi:predicted transcriptional regulator
MDDEAAVSTQKLVQLTADTVSAYVSNNAVSTATLPQLISSVHAAFSGLGKQAPEPVRPIPPVPINKSVTPEYLISLEDGRHYKALKRHLRRLGMTPEEYRTKWGLSPDYPMVAAEYAKRRAELAKALGLGRQRAKLTPPPKPPRPRK